MASLWAVKLSLLLVLFALALVFGLIPFKLYAKLQSPSASAHRAWTSEIVCLLNCFAGGIFLGTSFLHLLPEVREGFEEIWRLKGWNDVSFPVGECVVICGFFIIVTIETVVQALQHRSINSESTIAICTERFLEIGKGGRNKAKRAKAKAFGDFGRLRLLFSTTRWVRC